MRSRRNGCAWPRPISTARRVMLLLSTASNSWSRDPYCGSSIGASNDLGGMDGCTRATAASSYVRPSSERDG